MRGIRLHTIFLKKFDREKDFEYAVSISRTVRNRDPDRMVPGIYRYSASYRYTLDTLLAPLVFVFRSDEQSPDKIHTTDPSPSYIHRDRGHPLDSRPGTGDAV